MVVGLGFRFAGAAMPVIVLSKPEIMDAYPHCSTEQFGLPLLLFMIHRAMMANTVLLLKISPFFGELTSSKKVVLTNHELLL
jgi:hypothetical protein